MNKILFLKITIIGLSLQMACLLPHVTLEKPKTLLVELIQRESFVVVFEESRSYVFLFLFKLP